MKLKFQVFIFHPLQENENKKVELTSWCLEPSQPQGTISGLRENLGNEIQLKMP